MPIIEAEIKSTSLKIESPRDALSLKHRGNHPLERHRRVYPTGV